MKNYPISLLCRIAGVSKSEYYKWWKNADKVKDEFDILLIAEMFAKSRVQNNKNEAFNRIRDNNEPQKDNKNNEKIRNDNKNQKNKSI